MAYGAYLLLALGAGALYYSNVLRPAAQDEALDHWRKELAARASVRHEAIEFWLATALADARTVAAFPSAQADLERARGSSRPVVDTHMSAVLGAYVSLHGYRSAVLLDLRGLPLAQGGPDLDRTVREWARGVAARRTAAAEMLQGDDGAPVVAFAVPIPGLSGAAGATVLTDDPREWLFPFVEGSRGGSSESLLARSDGATVQFLSPLGFDRGPVLSVTRPAANLPAKAAAEGVEGFFSSSDYRGVPVLAVTRHIESTRWGVVAKIDREEALAEIRERLRVTAMAGIAVIAAAGLAGLGIAFGARRAQESALAERRAELALLLDQASDAILIVDTRGRITACNRRATELYRSTEAELRRTAFLELAAPEDVRAVARAFASVVTTGESRIEAAHRRRDGSPVAVEVSARLARWAGREAVVAIARDVSEPKAARERGLQLNALLRTLSLAKSAMVQAENRQDLLQRVCRALAEDGPACLAWVGLVDAPSRQVRPAAWAGPAAGYMKGLVVTLDGPHSLGPTGRAILTGSPAVIQDSATDPGMAPWREAQRAHGLCASAAFPVRLEKEVVGALTVYMARAGAVGAEEEALFSEMAAGLSVALTSLHHREQRSLVEAELLERGARLQAVLESPEEAVFSVDAQLRYTSFNRAHFEATRRVYGCEIELGLSVLDHISVAEDREAARLNFARALGGERFVHQRAWGDGELERRFFDVSYGPIRSPEGHVSGVAVFAVDRTDSRRAETALARSERKYRRLHESMRDAFVSTDLDGHILEWNSAYRELVGYSDGELRTLTYQDLTPARWRAFEARLVREQILPRGHSEVYEKEYRHKDGRNVPVELRTFLVPAEGDEAGLMWALVRDISDRKRAEQELRESREDLERAQQVAHLGSWELDLAAARGHWSAEMFRLFERDASLGAPPFAEFLASIHPDHRATLLAAQARAVERATAQLFQCQILTGSGGTRWLEARIQPLVDAQGRVLRLAGTLLDIDERKRLELELRGLNETLEARVAERAGALQAANRELEAFSYSVSHDLRAPLRGVNGFARVLAEELGPAAGTEPLRLLGLIQQNALHMGQLIDDLLAFSRAGRAELRSERTDLAALAVSVFDELAPAMGRRAELSVGALPQASADPALVRQVLQNLLSNALKYSAGRANPRVELSGRVEGREAVYTVADNGVGFDMRYADKLFGVFQRLHSARDFEGTGVGLALVRRIVERHGGRVWAEGRVGEGATFHMALPLAEEP